MSVYQIGLTALGMVDADTVFGLFPRSVPGQELVTDHGGGLVEVGYDRTTWIFSGILIATYKTAIQTTLAMTGFSREVYIQTRDEFDVWTTNRAIIKIPAPEALERGTKHYIEVPLEFVLLEVIP